MTRKYPTISGRELIKRVKVYGYVKVRQKGSHISISNGKHTVSVPDHKELALGLLADIIKDIANNIGIDEKEIIERLR